MYGDESILIKAGEYYGVDLSPLLKLVYTNDEVSAAYINANTQQTHFLLSLTKTLHERISLNKSVCDKIKYKAYDTPIEFSDEQKQQLLDSLGKEFETSILELFETQKKEMLEDTNPWKSYFENGEVLVDLESLIAALECFESKGVFQVYLGAG